MWNRFTRRLRFLHRFLMSSLQRAELENVLTSLAHRQFERFCNVFQLQSERLQLKNTRFWKLIEQYIVQRTQIWNIRSFFVTIVLNNLILWLVLFAIGRALIRLFCGIYSEAQSSGTLNKEQSSESFLAQASAFLTACAAEQIRLAPDKCKFELRLSVFTSVS